MTKSELVEIICQTTTLPKGRAKLVVDTIFDAMTAALERGEGIEIRGFASFSVHHYKAYSARNPRAGTSVWVSEKRLPFFRCGKELKELINGQPADSKNRG